MSADARARLALRLAADYANGGHRKFFAGDLNDVANIVAEAVAADADAISQQQLGAATLAALLAISGGTQGIGVPDADQLPLAGLLGSAAFLDIDAVQGIATNVQNGAYQIVRGDGAALLVSSSGTNTWTLPLSSDVPLFYYFRYRNRSGNNLTVQRTSPDTIEGATTALTIATGTNGIIVRGGTNWERG